MALLEVGSTAPTFKGTNLTGPEINLENFKGKKHVVLIFAPDRVDPTGTNAVKAVYNKFKDKVEIITASRKVPSVSMAKAFLQQLGIKFSTLYDPTQAVYKLYGVENPAVVYMIDPEGKIVVAEQLDPTKVDAKALEDAIVANVK